MHETKYYGPVFSLLSGSCKNLSADLGIKWFIYQKWKAITLASTACSYEGKSQQYLHNGQIMQVNITNGISREIFRETLTFYFTIQLH